MTTETYPLNPIVVNFDISFTPEDIYLKMLQDENGKCVNDLSNSYLEITIADNALYSTTAIMNNVVNSIQQVFKPENCVLGQQINYDSILNSIYAINGIERVRTVYYPNGYPDITFTHKSRACDGIAFASWSDTKLIDIGDDLEINNTTRSL